MSDCPAALEHPVYVKFLHTGVIFRCGRFPGSDQWVRELNEGSRGWVYCGLSDGAARFIVEALLDRTPERKKEVELVTAMSGLYGKAPPERKKEEKDRKPFKGAGGVTIMVPKAPESPAWKGITLRNGMFAQVVRLNALGVTAWYWVDNTRKHHTTYVRVPLNLLPADLEAPEPELAAELSAEDVQRAQKLGDAYLRAKDMAASMFDTANKAAAQTGDLHTVMDVAQAYAELVTAMSGLYGKALGF